jgi:transcriptional regulator with XRE-family HTH domain
MKNIQEKIKEALQNAGLTQKELGIKAGFSQQGISRWLNGYTPKIKNLQKIAEVLGLPVNFFLENSGISIGGCSNVTRGNITQLNSTQENGNERKTTKNDTFRQKLKLKMIENKLTQQNLADKVGVSRQQVNYWLKGIHTPTNRTLRKIAETFGIPLSWFFDNSETPAPASTGSVETPSETIETLKKEIEILKLQNDLLSKALLIERKK